MRRQNKDMYIYTRVLYQLQLCVCVFFITWLQAFNFDDYCNRFGKAARHSWWEIRGFNLNESQVHR